jgi:3-oxoacyl-[acyl-carrier-protein] synthase II
MAYSHATWVTGIGTISSLGSSFSEISENLLGARSGIRPVTNFNVAEHPCQIAGQVTEVPCPDEVDPELFAAMTPIEQAPLWCCARALQDAGLWQSRRDIRIGIVLGLGAECMQSWDADYRRGGDRCFDPRQDHESAMEKTCRLLNLNGPHLSIAAACASGNHALLHGRRWLQMGLADVVLAGACDMGVSPYSLAGFGNLRALSRRNHDPSGALRPFDLDRDGMVLGEGGAVFVLEHPGGPARRQRQPYAELAGVGATSDAHHMVIPSPDPAQGVLAMQLAMQDAGVRPEDIDYVNAHATGTPVGDAGETRILRAALGTAVETVHVSATKSMTGHLLGAAAALEALACITAIHYGAIPPTINLDRPDPACELRHVANHTVERQVRVAVSNSFGFGGHNTSLILKAMPA